MQDYTKLLVWQRTRTLTVAVHEATRAIPSRTVPGLRAQLMRSTMSIAANVAEGAARDSRADFARFVGIAAASASETEHHLTVCCDLGILDAPMAAHLIGQVTEIRRMLFGLRRALLVAELKEHRGEASRAEWTPAVDPTLFH